MRLNINLIGMLAVAALASPSLSAETKTIIGIDAVDIETTLTYGNGEETYDLTGVRLRYGIENSLGGSAGIELISGDSAETLDPFGNLFRLETDVAFGAYATIGKPVHIRIGWSIWQTEYTDVALGITDTDTVNSLELGIGLNIALGRNLTFFADWSVRDTDAEYPSHISGTGEVDYRSEIWSLGFNFKF